MKKYILLSSLLIASISASAQTYNSSNSYTLTREYTGQWTTFVSPTVGFAYLPNADGFNTDISMFQIGVNGGVKYYFPKTIWSLGVKGNLTYGYGKYNPGTSVDVNNLSITATPFIEADLDPFAVYTGIGIGGIYTRLGNSNNNVTSSDFMISVPVGIRYNINKLTSLTLEYTYSNYNYKFYNYKHNVNQHGFLLGVMFSF